MDRPRICLQLSVSSQGTAAPEVTYSILANALDCARWKSKPLGEHDDWMHRLKSRAKGNCDTIRMDKKQELPALTSRGFAGSPELGGSYMKNHPVPGHPRSPSSKPPA